MSRIITNTLAIFFCFSLGIGTIQAQTSYQTPPKSIVDLVDTPPTPSVSFTSDGEWMMILSRPGYAGIEDLSSPELRIAGTRINPQTSGSSRQGYFNNITFKKTRSGEEVEVKGLPEFPKLSGFSLSQDEKYLAFTQTYANGISLWVADLNSFEAKQITDPILNGVLGTDLIWLPDNTIVFRAINPNRGDYPQKPAAPSGPTIQETDGAAAATRTYQDLLKNTYDEALFAYFMDSQLMKADLSGSVKPIGKAGMIRSLSSSPDGEYLLIRTIEKPFSYLVPASRFPYRVEILSSSDGSLVKTLAEIPLDEVRPKGFDATVEGPRSVNWRADKPATLYWAEAQDGGDPQMEVDERDVIYTLEAPFNGEKNKIASTKLRYSYIDWSDDNLAILNERWWSSRQEIRSVINPSNPKEGQRVIIDRLYSDIYNDPGSPISIENEFGRSVLLRDGDKIYMTSEGGSPEGSMPFLSSFDLNTGEQEILWRSQAPYYERITKVLDLKGGEFISLKEGTETQPNYWLVNTRKRMAPRQITDFPDPYESIKGVQKELVTYKRKDGLDLSAVIYTPEGYDPETDGPLPVLMWAYPREYKSAEVASQVRGSKYRFTRLSWGSPIYWVTRGYAVMDRTEMPIVGEGDIEPNDLFVDQLVANAEAAIDYVVERGIGDRDRIGVGGHSYGAFMTANLLSHSDLFAAGIARSGAYNRTLTPFGFQREERTFWEAPEVYFTMSPFMHAHKVKEPILLIHGEADNNSGTFPIQSERYYAALKGNGGTARLVFLPNESHGYASRESILHTLWEMDTWLEKYVKNKNQLDEKK
ncbi:S9 family peptidase [Algoriphagus sediminis]|uniref:Prolyl oligopeptidase family serine peptidase n=1 Tax=Algoriphagus sediminis TaxID=3057113 RepID=A0ABT7YC78_9BACT|nr:prolyl oligopeptidase family serine peptidase [Algoriphagus sediminis]MDN3204000.1 prolyl oligopeptidase family serine peptidase [Algoriphagus sediminis]